MKNFDCDVFHVNEAPPKLSCLRGTKEKWRQIKIYKTAVSNQVQHSKRSGNCGESRQRLLRRLVQLFEKMIAVLLVVLSLGYAALAAGTCNTCPQGNSEPLADLICKSSIGKLSSLRSYRSGSTRSSFSIPSHSRRLQVRTNHRWPSWKR